MAYDTANVVIPILRWANRSANSRDGRFLSCWGNRPLFTDARLSPPRFEFSANPEEPELTRTRTLAHRGYMIQGPCVPVVTAQWLTEGHAQMCDHLPFWKLESDV